MEHEQVIIVCASAYAEMTVAGSVFTHFCSKCMHRVMLSTSGQMRLRNIPDAKLVCSDCFLTDEELQSKVTEARFSAASREELAQELRSVQPNHWRARN